MEGGAGGREQEEGWLRRGGAGRLINLIKYLFFFHILIGLHSGAARLRTVFSTCRKLELILNGSEVTAIQEPAHLSLCALGRAGGSAQPSRWLGPAAAAQRGPASPSTDNTPRRRSLVGPRRRRQELQFPT